jgi:hypothetical protein
MDGFNGKTGLILRDLTNDIYPQPFADLKINLQHYLGVAGTVLPVTLDRPSR